MVHLSNCVLFFQDHIVVPVLNLEKAVSLGVLRRLGHVLVEGPAGLRQERCGSSLVPAIGQGVNLNLHSNQLSGQLSCWAHSELVTSGNQDSPAVLVEGVEGPEIRPSFPPFRKGSVQVPEHVVVGEAILLSVAKNRCQDNECWAWHEALTQEHKGVLLIVRHDKVVGEAVGAEDLPFGQYPDVSAMVEQGHVQTLPLEDHPWQLQASPVVSREQRQWFALVEAPQVDRGSFSLLQVPR